ncbi:MAG TPA: glycine cleavage T C-terminal barrel domain-containing protein [Actinomycetales bacterium]|nr:glycine cleavage T C-terminal barrel domain-containing protein [Actinomycetales bacterium]
MSSPLLMRPGAVAGKGADAKVAAHYGEPLREQRLLLASKAIVDQSHLAVVTVTGPDRLKWLHSITSQHLESLEPGVCVETLVLDPQGRIDHAAAVVDDGETTWFITEADHGADLAKWLDSMRFMMRVEVTDATQDWAVIGYSDPDELLSAQLKPAIVWDDPWPRILPGGTRYGAPDEEHPGAHRYWRLALMPRSEFVGRLGELSLAGTWAAEALRIEAGRPRLATEVDARALPHELDWLRTAVHLDKGCYRGQESIARVHNMGRPPRRLVQLLVDGSTHELPQPGMAVLNGDREVGKVTSAAQHHELGPVALALIRRSTPADAQLWVENMAAAQEVLVSPEGISAHRPPPRPKIPRGAAPPKK